MALVSIYDKHREAVDDMLEIVKANQEELYEKKETKKQEISERADTIGAYIEKKNAVTKSFWKLGTFCIIKVIRLILSLDKDVDKNEFLEASKSVKEYFETIDIIEKLQNENKIASRELREITAKYNEVTRQVEFFENVVGSGIEDNTESEEAGNKGSEDE